MGSDKPPRGDDDKSPLVDLYQDSQIQIDPALKARLRDAAREVSQGPWRERAFSPRSKLGPEEILAGLTGSLKLALLHAESPTSDPTEARAEVKTAWLPFVQQAIEQAGGDGLDALLWALLGRKQVPARDPMVVELLSGYAAMNRATTLDGFMAEAGKVQSLLERHLTSATPRPLSFKALEKDLEGRMDLDAVLGLLFSTDGQLASRLADVQQSLENLRTQMKGSMGTQPNALLWNFARLKAERILIEAEQRRRQAP